MVAGLQNEVSRSYREVSKGVGSRGHAPWALALEATLSTRAGFAVQTLYSDDGIVLRFADVEEELPGWTVTVGPREAAHIPGFLKSK